VAFAFTKAGVNTPAVQELKAKYNIQLGDPAAIEKHKTDTEALYRKLLDGQGLTDEEIGGRLVLIDQQPATATQLRALPPSIITGFAIGDGPAKKFGEAGRKGTVIVLTSRAAATDKAASQADGLDQAMYFLDGQSISKAAVDQLDPAVISSMQVLKGEQAQSFQDAATPARPVILIVTKANEKSAAVREFNKQHHIGY
jgi:ParB-like chromosome segregation protein Spo0J